MEFKFEEFFHVSGKLSAKEVEEAKALLLKTVTGAKQNIIGEKRRELAEGFFNLVDPDRKKRLEEEIAALHVTKDEGRFRVQLLLMLFEAFYSGTLFEQGVQELKKEAPEQK